MSGLSPCGSLGEQVVARELVAEANVDGERPARPQLLELALRRRGNSRARASRGRAVRRRRMPSRRNAPTSAAGSRARARRAAGRRRSRRARCARRCCPRVSSRRRPAPKCTPLCVLVTVSGSVAMSASTCVLCSPKSTKTSAEARRRQRGQHSRNDSRELRCERGWILHRVARLETDESAEARVGVAEHVAAERELGADEQLPQRPAVARVDLARRLVVAAPL